MKKELLSGLIIGLIIVGGIVGIGYYKYSASQKVVNDYAKMLEGMTDEQRQVWLNQQMELMKNNVKSTCDTVIAGKTTENDCAKLISSYKDVCYYCFATKNQNQSICGLISDSGLKESCKKDSGSSTGASITEQIDEELNVAKNDARDASIKGSMHSMRVGAEIAYEISGGYGEVNCSNTQLSSDCSRVENYAGVKPTLHSNQGAYCAFAKLFNGNYYCIDSKGNSTETSISPSSKGYCDGLTFSCPK